MALADIRQRPGVLLGAALLLHVVLISAQVNTASGLPVLQVVTGLGPAVNVTGTPAVKTVGSVLATAHTWPLSL